MNILMLAIVFGIGFSVLTWYIGKVAGRLQSVEVIMLYLIKRVPTKQEKKAKKQKNSDRWKVVGQTLKARGGV
jgi:hypothetical protein